MYASSVKLIMPDNLVKAPIEKNLASDFSPLHRFTHLRLRAFLQIFRNLPFSLSSWATYLSEPGWPPGPGVSDCGLQVPISHAEAVLTVLVLIVSPILNASYENHSILYRPRCGV